MNARTIWLSLAAVIAVLIGARVVSVRNKAKATIATPPAATVVKTTRVRRAPIDEKVVFTGSVKPRNEVEIFTKLPGRIEAQHVQVGDKVKAGQLLAVIEHKEIGWQAKASQAALQTAKANMAGAQADLARTQKLFEGGSAPQAQLEGAQLRVALAEAQSAQAEAAAGLAQQQLANARVESPIAGTVVKRTGNVGVNAGPQQALFTIQDVAALRLESSVDAETYLRLQKEAQAAVTVQALPGLIFNGKVTVLSPSLDPSTRRAALEIEIDNTNGKLLPHMFATATVQVGRLEDALLVPKEALLLASTGATVFRVVDGKAEALHPKLGARDEASVQVLDLLAEGDEVVVGGLGSLADGVRVKVAASPAGAESTASAELPRKE